MSCYVGGKKMPNWYKPELYDEEYLKELIDTLYHDCSDNGCEECPLAGQLDGESCKVDVILELSRRWSNLKHFVDFSQKL